MSTQRQIAANRRNSEHSTGPKTAEGKAASRQNSYQHGLAGEGTVLPPALQRKVQEEADAWAVRFAATDLADLADCYSLALAEIQVRQAVALHDELHQELLQRGTHGWDHDRKLAVAKLAAKLPKQPEVVSLELRDSAPGARWLITRWTDLIRILEAGLEWEDAERTTALDLLGVPLDARRVNPDLTPREGVAERDHLVNLAWGEIEALEALKAEVLDAREDHRRQFELERGGLCVRHPELTRLSRYQERHLRRGDKARAALEKRQTARQTASAETPETPKKAETKEVKFATLDPPDFVLQVAGFEPEEAVLPVPAALPAPGERVDLEAVLRKPGLREFEADLERIEVILADVGPVWLSQGKPLPAELEQALIVYGVKLADQPTQTERTASLLTKLSTVLAASDACRAGALASAAAESPLREAS